MLADAGGRNSAPSRVWKQHRQAQLGDRFGLTVTVCHYPTGCSKGNPIEHRLFGPLSINWAGQPLRTWDTVLSYRRGTSTTTGLQVRAELLAGDFPTGERVSDADMNRLTLHRHTVGPTGNDTPRPRSGAAADVFVAANRDVVS